MAGMGVSNAFFSKWQIISHAVELSPTAEGSTRQGMRGTTVAASKSNHTEKKH